MYAASVLSEGQVVSVVCADGEGGEDVVDAPTGAAFARNSSGAPEGVAQEAAGTGLNLSEDQSKRSLYKFILAYSYIVTLIVMMVS